MYQRTAVRYKKECAGTAAVKAAGGSMTSYPRPFGNTGRVVKIAIDPVSAGTLHRQGTLVKKTALLGPCHLPIMCAGSRLFSSQMLSMRSVSGSSRQASLTDHGLV